MEKLTEAQLREMADLIGQVIVIRDSDKDGNTRDYSRPAFDAEADIISKVAYAALFAQNCNIDFDCSVQRQTLMDMAEAMTNQLLPNCNAYSTIRVPLDNAFTQWERFLAFNPSVNKNQLDDRKLFEETQLEEWAGEIGKFITNKSTGIERLAVAGERATISEVALAALKVLNSCDNLEEFSQAKTPVLRNAKEKIERLLPYCRGQKTIYEPLEKMLVHFEIKFREVGKLETKNKPKNKDTMERD